MNPDILKYPQKKLTKAEEEQAYKLINEAMADVAKQGGAVTSEMLRVWDRE